MRPKGQEVRQREPPGAGPGPYFQDQQQFPKRSNKQKHFYSGKKRRDTFKSQFVVDKKTKQVICTAFTNGKRHDFRLFKESKTRIGSDVKVITDTGYQVMQKLHSKSELPKKKSKKTPLTKEEKKRNQELASEKVANEHVIGMIKRFKIISDKYRNRRKRFGLRLNLIAAIYNMELIKS